MSYLLSVNFFSCSVSFYQHVSTVFFSLFLVLISYHLYFPASQCCPSYILFTVCWHHYCSIPACQCVSANPFFFPICCLLISLFALYILPSLWVLFLFILFSTWWPLSCSVFSYQRVSDATCLFYFLPFDWSLFCSVLAHQRVRVSFMFICYCWPLFLYLFLPLVGC